MDVHRLPRGLGWLSVGLGLTGLTFAEGLCRLLALRRGAAVVRLVGARELLTGVGLLSQPKRRPWLWGRVIGDAIDLSLLGAASSRSAETSPWRFVAIAAVLGITVVDVYAATGIPVRRTQARLDIGDYVNSHVPAESWRGSGLAEDIGVSGHGTEGTEVDEEARQQRMRDAQEQLGLPDPEDLGSRT